MSYLKLYTFRINRTGHLRCSIADSAQHATAVFNEWIGGCTILRIETLPGQLNAAALATPSQLNSAPVYRREKKRT